MTVWPGHTASRISSLADHATRVLDEVAQYVEGLRSQLDRLLAPPQRALLQVED